MISRFIHVASMAEFSPFLRLFNIFLHIYTIYSYSFTNRHLGWFCVFAIVINTAMNIGVQTSFEILIQYPLEMFYFWVRYPLGRCILYSKLINLYTYNLGISL
jgi:hypothetical protein